VATPDRSETSLRGWLVSEFGMKYKLETKSKATGSQRPQGGSSSTQAGERHSSKSTAGPAKRHRSPKVARMFSIDNYAGTGVLAPGLSAQSALDAAASAAAGPAPTYILPEQALVARPLQFSPVMSATRAASHRKLLCSTQDGATHLAETHTPLHKLLECHSECAGLDLSSSSSSGARAGGLQVYDLVDLGLGRSAQHAADGQRLAVVPDSSRPFTITLHNTADGLDYVLARAQGCGLGHQRQGSSTVRGLRQHAAHHTRMRATQRADGHGRHACGQGRHSRQLWALLWRPWWVQRLQTPSAFWAVVVVQRKRASCQVVPVHLAISRVHLRTEACTALWCTDLANF
jgi:hypothetical protein